MRFEDGALPVLEGAWPVEGEVRHPDLADVVESEGVPKAWRACDFGGGRGSEFEAEFANPVYVLVGAGVPDSEHREHGVDDDILRLQRRQRGRQ